MIYIEKMYTVYFCTCIDIMDIKCRAYTVFVYINKDINMEYNVVY